MGPLRQPLHDLGMLLLAALLALGGAAACSDDESSGSADADTETGGGDADADGGEGDADADTGTGDVDVDGDADAAADGDAAGDAEADPDAGADAGTGDPSHCAPSTLAGRLEPGAWDARFTIPGLTGIDGFTPSVHALASDSDGSLLAAGYFRWAGTDLVGPLARRIEGTWEAARQDDLADDLSAVAVAEDGRFAVATYLPLLPVLPPVPQAGEILVDVGEGLETIGSFEGVVRALAWYDDTLWVGGHFLLAEGGPAELAVWADGTWSVPPGGAADGPVYVLEPEGDALLVGGSFASVGGIDALSVASYDGESWTALSLDGLEPAEGGGAFRGPIVYGLTRDDSDDTLYAGGIFFADGEPTSGGVARWTGASWELVGEGFAQYGGVSGDVAAVVSGVAVHQGVLYAAGCFTRSGDGGGTTPIPLPGVAVWTGEEWAAPAGGDPAGGVATSWYQSFVCGGEPSGTAILEAPIQSLWSDGALVYVGGSFPGLAGVPSQSLIAHDGTDWVPMGDTQGLGLSGGASELAVGGETCDVYAFGGVSHAGGTSGAPVYRFDGDGWAGVGAALPAGVSCSQLAVSPQGEVFIACETRFTLDTRAQPRVYRLAGESWELLPGLEDTNGSVVVGDLVFDPRGALWLVGSDGLEGFAARWAGESFDVVEDGFAGTMTSIAFAPDDGGPLEYVVGGGFTHVGEVAANRIALWDGEAWQPLGTGVGATVSALSYGDDAIFVTTHFEGSGGERILGRWDGEAWVELGTPANGLPAPLGESVHQFMQLYVQGDIVVAVGGVYPEAGARNAFVYDGDRFSPLGGGVGAISVEAVAVRPDALWFGGTIATTGTGEGLAPSVGVARFELAAEP